MKFSISALVLGIAALATAAPTTSYSAGFNLGFTHKSGACKTTAQYQQEFNKIKSWSKGGKLTFNTVKMFSTADCNALMQVVPAAIATGTKLWVGVWNVDDAKFGREKAALEQAMRQWPDTSKWLKGINVGSESLYRKEITAKKLAGQIKDVKGMVQVALKAPNVPVGTADTWTSWVDPANKEVIDACDVVLMNGFPYWQGAPVEQGLAKLQEAVANTRAVIGGKPFMIGETGWPSKGDNFGASVASKDNAQKYWKAAACWLQTTNYPWYWFSAFDEPNKGADHGGVERYFGVAQADQPLKISLKC
ncbi:glycoside hydrolase [Wilcoxina mikolae CBS 423.85]|nr:glycoside hydrolase [Wilcoxina mikolae CBS 423.85]